MTRHSFPMAFIATPCLVATPYVPAASNVYTITLEVESVTTFIINSWANYSTPPILSDSPLPVNFVAIGKWK